MIAFHGKPEIKEFYLNRLRKHRVADDIIRGTYGDASGKSGWRGCSIGCTLHSSDHAAGETELGIPLILWKLNDRLFESMTEGPHKDWPIRFLEAIPVGADLSLVPWQLLTFGIERMLPFAAVHPQSKKAIRRVLNEVLRPLAAGDEISAARVAAAAADAVDAADAAAYAARDDARTDAYVAADAADAADAAAYAADAAYVAADAVAAADAADAAAYAADAAAYAARAAAYAADAAAYAARAAYAEMDVWADELLRLLALAPVAVAVRQAGIRVGH